MLVTHDPSASAVTVIDPATRRVTGLLSVGRGAHDITFRPDSAEVYLTYWHGSAVARVDWGRGRVLFQRAVGSVPHHVQFDFVSGGHLWVSDQGRGEVLRLHAATGRVLRRYGGCPGAHHVALLGGSLYAVAACHDSGRLLTIDRDGSTGSIQVGRGLHGVAVAVLP